MPNINIGEIFSDNLSAKGTEATLFSRTNQKNETERIPSENYSLRDINISHPFYNHDDVKTISSDIESRLASGQNGLEHKNYMVLAESNMTEQDFSKMRGDGFSPEDLDEDAFVTVAEKIRVQMAKGGADVSMMGDISEAALKDAGVSEATAKSIQANEIYKPAEEINPEDFQKIRPQVEEVINSAGYAVTEDTLNAAKWLISESKPLTKESITDYVNYSLGKDNPYSAAVDTVKSIEAITDTQIENAIKNDAPITIASISAQEESLTSNDYIEKGSEKYYQLISAHREMEEIRLSMTLEVSLSMSMRGINVDTRPLSELVSDLKKEEKRLYENLFGDDIKGVSKELTFEERIDAYKETIGSVEFLKNSPVSLVTSIPNISEETIRHITDLSHAERSKYKFAEEKYEPLMTAPRKDMGDSIKKAFRNIDNILDDMGIEKTESNNRAVRILGYNNISITKENILTIRESDEILRRTLKELTPGVVAKMVKNGDNPLDINLEKLNEKIEEIKNETAGESEEDSYAEFLYKLDRQNELSIEQRNSYIGIYRLMHQVIKSDGAVIGALLNQGSEITMRNMMTAIRSDKHKNREVTIDDSFGGRADFKLPDLSITQQIEMAFQTSRLKDAKEAISPSKLMNFPNEDSYMNLSPDKFASELEGMEENIADEHSFIKELQMNVSRSIQSEERVYEALRQFDIPTSAANLQAMKEFLSDRNSVYRKVFSRTVSDEDLEKTPKELMSDIIKRFGEAIKSPEDMADAQEKLARTAENVMKKMMVETEVSHKDIQGIKVSVRQIRMLGQIAKDAENYTIPITVADENGTLNLRVVRGKDEENGLVDIAFNMDKTGPVNATFKYESHGIQGSISAVRTEVLDMISDMETNLSEALANVAEENVSIRYNHDVTLTEESIYKVKDIDFESTREQTEISTSRLYSIAKAFIDILGNSKI